MHIYVVKYSFFYHVLEIVWKCVQCNRNLVTALLTQEKNSSNITGNASEIIVVPFDAIGRVIGKGGKMLKELRIAYACKLDFLRHKAKENGDTPLLITSLRDEKSDLEGVLDKINCIVSHFSNNILLLTPSFTSTKTLCMNFNNEI